MKAIVVSLALFVASALALTINTPANVVECEPTLLSWSGGTGPYYLSVLPGATPNGQAIESFPATNDTSYTWTCNIEANTYIGFTLRDSTGTVAQTAPLTISSGTSTSCVNVTSVAGGSATSGATSPASTATTTTPGSSAGTSSTPAHTSSSSSPSSSPSSSSGASANVAQLGAAGLAGVAIAALFL